MNVDFLHNQIIRDTITPAFIESFNENLLPSLELKYGESLECVQFYEDHLRDGMRIGGIFYYPLTLVISGVAKTIPAGTFTQRRVFLVRSLWRKKRIASLTQRRTERQKKGSSYIICALWSILHANLKTPE